MTRIRTSPEPLTPEEEIKLMNDGVTAYDKRNRPLAQRVGHVECPECGELTNIVGYHAGGYYRRCKTGCERVKTLKKQGGYEEITTGDEPVSREELRRELVETLLFNWVIAGRPRNVKRGQLTDGAYREIADALRIS